jgi:hypothetical protein
MRVWLQRQVSAIVVTSGQATLEAKEATETIERGDHRGKRSRPHGFIAAGEFREVVRKPLGGSGAAPCLSASGLLQTIDRGLECRDIVGVCRVSCWCPAAAPDRARFRAGEWRQAWAAGHRE